MEPVVCAPTDPYALTEEDLPELFRQYELLAEEMIRRKKSGKRICLLSLHAGLEKWPVHL